MFHLSVLRPISNISKKAIKLPTSKSNSRLHEMNPTIQKHIKQSIQKHKQLHVQHHSQDSKLQINMDYISNLSIEEAINVMVKREVKGNNCSARTHA